MGNASWSAPGTMARLIREHEWQATPVGNAAGWPQPLRTLLDVMLGSSQPMFVAWGPERTLVYNDAYAAILANKHPAALGRPFLDVWHEIRDDLVPIVEQAFRGEPVQMDDITLVMERRGFPEEAHFAFSYTPIHDEAGPIAGFFCVCQETTARVLAERSKAFRLGLEERLRTAATPLAALAVACEALGRRLDAALCAIGEVEQKAGGETFNSVRAEWRAGATASAVGRHRLADYGPERVADLLSGEPVLVEDVRSDPRTGGTAAEEAYAALGCLSSLDVPLMRDGHVRALLAVGLPQAHQWSAEEVALARETAERCWAAAERVRAELALAESEQRVRADAERVQLALDAGAIVGTWNWDLPTDRFTADDRFARSFGLDPEECRQGLRIDQVVATVHPEDKPGLMGAIAEVVRRGGRYAHQYRVRGHDDVYRWIEANGRVDLAPDGTALRFPGVLLDVEERRRTEESLRQTTRRLDAILSNTREAVFLMDHRQHCIYANAAAEMLTGYRFEEMQGRPLHDVVHHKKPDGSHYPLEECPIDRAFPERAQMSGEEIFVAPDGSFYPVAFTASPVLDDEGRPVGTVIEARGIAEEKTRDAALRESEERFRNMADHAPVMMWVTDETGSCTYLNRFWYEFTGQTQEEALGLGWLEATHPEDKSEAERLFIDATARQEPFRLEYRLRRADGTWRWAIDAAAPRFGHRGEFLGFIGSVIDIDERRGMEEALRARTAELESLLVSAPLGVAFFDREHRWVRINEELAAINGFSVEDHIGRRIEDLVPVNARLVGPLLDRVFETGATIRDIEITGETASAPAAFCHWLVNFYPVRGAGGAVSTVGTWVVDITSRKEAEELLRESEERYRTLFETIESGFCLIEVRQEAPAGASEGRIDYRVIEANPAFYTQTGFPQAILGRWLREAAPGLEEHWFETYGRVARTGEPVRIEQGSALLGRWFDVYAFRQGEPDAGRVGLLFNDISARRNAEEALRELNETLEHRVEEAIAQREQAEEALRQSQKMEAVGQLTGGIAHDFNNMLAAVVGSLDLLERRIGDGDARARRYVDAAMEGARRAALLTQRLLAFSRQQPLKPEAVDVNRLVQGMSDLLGRSLGAGIRIETVLADGLWKAHADPNQLENVILNLAVNARDAMPEGGRLGIETANAHLDSGGAADHPGVPPGQYVRIAVTDTGTGMSPEVLAKAFEPFFTTKPVGQGTGLGLSQVYGFVKQSGGHLKISSEPGQGTTVEVYLPRLLASQAETPAEEPPRELRRGEAQEVVLVVEDEPMVRQFTVDALGELGYRVIEADGAAVALGLLDAHPEVALLFTDVVMPDTNGRRLADEALRRRPDLRVLFTTGYTRNAVVHDGVLDPGVHLIGKPFTIEALAAKLREVLEEPRPSR